MDFLEFLIWCFTPDFQAIRQYWLEIAVFIAVFGGIPILAYLSEHLNAKTKTPSSHQAKRKASPTSNTRELQTELLTLLHWDYSTVKRTLGYLKKRYPNKSSNWYLEKAIADLLRDRRR